MLEIRRSEFVVMFDKTGIGVYYWVRWITVAYYGAPPWSSW